MGETYIESYVPLPLLALASDLDSIEYMRAIIPARPAQGNAPAASLSPALLAHGAQFLAGRRVYRAGHQSGHH